MKVMIDGSEMELEKLEPGAIELDKLTIEKDMNTKDTLEITEEMLKKIKEELGTDNHE